MVNETWKPVKGYEGLYEVSDLGNVKSLLRKQGLLSLILNSYGYYQVNLCNNGLRKRCSVHRLVIDAFIGLPSIMHVDHVNSLRTDNRLINLRACTLEENLRFNNVRKEKTSLFVGVSWNKAENKWVAQIQVAGRKKTLGRFSDPNKASDAYQNALANL